MARLECQSSILCRCYIVERAALDTHESPAHRHTGWDEDGRESFRHLPLPPRPPVQASLVAGAGGVSPRPIFKDHLLTHSYFSFLPEILPFVSLGAVASVGVTALNVWFSVLIPDTHVSSSCDI